jgi:hypothetical protein
MKRAVLDVMAAGESCTVSRSSFYRFDPDGKSGADRDMELRDAIQRIALEWPCYGRPRITAELRRQGWTGNHKRVYRLMREDNLRVPEPGARVGADRYQSALDCGFNLPPAGNGVRVSGGDSGCLLPPGDRLGAGKAPSTTS